MILYALLCGTLPFDDENIPNLFKKIKVYPYKRHTSNVCRLKVYPYKAIPDLMKMFLSHFKYFHMHLCSSLQF